MGRLMPFDHSYEEQSETLSIRISPRLLALIEAERDRLGSGNRSEVGRLILEEYFKQPVD